MAEIDLNADLGEGFPWDEALLGRVTSASICCGAHAGDEQIRTKTLSLAKERGVTVGAHPGFDDREGFGRRERAIGFAEVRALVFDQVSHLASLADRVGVPLRFVKPHGALYNQAQRDPEIARGIIAAIENFRGQMLSVFGLPGSEIEKAARDSGVNFLAEGFADRGYRDDGSLIPRGEPGARLDDPVPVAEQIVRLATSGRIQTLCLHGDDPNSLALADLVCETLQRRGITIRGLVP